jgi:hypothetical protein
VVGAPTLPRHTELASGLSTEGDLYLYVGTVTDDLFVVFEPASLFDDARAVWQVT